MFTFSTFPQGDDRSMLYPQQVIFSASLLLLVSIGSFDRNRLIE